MNKWNLDLRKRGRMPNWTNNVIEITGNIDDVNKLMNDITTNDDNEITYKLTKTKPIPDELQKIREGRRTIDDISYDVWYEDDDGTVRPMMDITKQELIDKYGTYKSLDWQYRNWGTKWGDCDTQVLEDTTKDNKREVKLTFDSAWGEPFMLLNDIARDYKLNIINTHLTEFEYDSEQTNYPWTDDKTTDVYDDFRDALSSTKKMIDDMVR